MRGRSLLVVLASTAIFCDVASAATPPDEIPTIGEMVSTHLSDAGKSYIEYAGAKATLGSQIQQARDAYWAAYPNGENLKQLEATYADLLWQKDLYYLTVRSADEFVKKLTGDSDAALRQRFGKGRAELLDAVSNPLDGGIQPRAKRAFDSWVYRVVEAAAAKRTLIDPTKLPDSIRAASGAYADYKKLRDIEEYFRSSHSPMNSEDPKAYYQGLMVRTLQCDSMAKAGERYDALCADLGEPLVRGVVDKVRKAPRQPDGYLLANTSFDEPAVFFSVLLSSTVMDSGSDRAKTIWSLGSKNYQAAVKLYGQEKVDAAMRDAARVPKEMFRQRLRVLLPLDALYAGRLQIVHSIAAKTICEDKSGALIVVTHGDSSFQQILRLPKDGGQAQVIYAPPVGGALSRGRTRAAGRGEAAADAAPTVASPRMFDAIVVAGDWIYGAALQTLGASEPYASGMLFRVRTDGQGLQRLRQFTSVDSPPDSLISSMVLDGNGRVLGASEREVFRIFPEQGNIGVMLKPDASAAQTYSVSSGPVGDAANNVYVPAYRDTINNGRITRHEYVLLKMSRGEISKVLLAEDPLHPEVGDLSALVVGRDQAIYAFARNNHDGNRSIVRISTDTGQVSTLRQLSSHDELLGRLAFSPDGAMLFGVLQLGGRGKHVLFRMRTDGSGYEVLEDFSANGAQLAGPYDPITGLTLLSDGALYGSTASGGKRGAGTIYRLSIDASGTPIEPPPTALVAASQPAAPAPAALPPAAPEPAVVVEAPPQQPAATPETSTPPASSRERTRSRANPRGAR